MNKTVFSAMLMFILLWVFFKDKASAAMLHRPMNLVVRTGESMQLSCLWENGSNPIDWYHTPVGSSDERKINDENQIVNTIFNGSTLNGSIPGQNLVIMSAQKLHAGLYTCTSMIEEEDGLMSIEKAAAHVVFLDAIPVCQMRSSVVEKENGTFEVCCMLSHTGSLVPKMKWSLANSNNKLNKRELNATSVISQNNAISTLNTFADFTVHGSRFICETVFEIPPTKMNPIVAENSPNYSYTWESSYVQVIYGPRNLRVNPPGDVFYPDDLLTCSAEGNPIPEVLWLNLETNEVINGPIITIVDAMIRDQPHEFLCSATNPTTNRSLEVRTEFSVKPASLQLAGNVFSDSQQHSAKVVQLKAVLAVTLAVSAVIIASLTFYVIASKRKRQRISREVPIIEEGTCNEVNPKTPLSRVSRYKSLPLPSTKFQFYDNSDYLSPHPRPPSDDYDEIPDPQPVTFQNDVYLEMAPEASTQSPNVPSQMSRPVNEYLQVAELEPTTKPTVYETLIKPQ